jgi:hypothetical protein
MRERSTMKGRYELRHQRLGRGLKFTSLELAYRELRHAQPAGEWFIYDRADRCEVK